MKKLLLSMFCALGLLSANAETVTFDFTSSSYGLPPYSTVAAEQIYVTNPSTITQDNVEITFSTFTDGKTNSWRMWSDGLRAYYNGNPQFTVKTKDGSNVTSVAITSKSGVYKVSGDSSNLPKSNNVMTWTGSESSITFDYASTSGNNAISSIEVTYGEGGGEVTPPVDPEPDPDPSTGDEATFDFTTNDYGMPNDGNTYVTVPYSFSEGAVTMTINGDTSSWRMWSDGLRQYRTKNPTFTLSVSSGKITKVEWTYASGVKITQNGNDVTTSGWTGSAESVTFSTSSSTGNNAIKTITVTYEGAKAPTVAAPVVKTENNMVTMTCATDGAQIFYNLEGETPDKDSMEYTAPFPITSTVSGKAIAYLNGEYSAVTSFTANYVGTYDSFEDLIAEGKGAKGTVSGPITVVYQNGQYLYVVDSKDYPGLLYGSNTNSYTNGDQFASVDGTVDIYNGLPEITSYTVGALTQGGTPVEPMVVTAEEIAVDNVNAYLEFQGMTVDATAKTITDETGTVTLYSRFSDVTIPTEDAYKYTVRGFLAIYNNNLQLYPTEFIQEDNGKETVATPTFDPNGGAVEAGTKVTIACETDGATIYYTLDGTTPTEDNGTIYSDAIEITTATTIKAIAVAPDMNNSSVATAEFTIFDPNATSATFNFTVPAEVGVEVGEATEYDLTGKTLTSGVVSLLSEAPSNAANKPRLFQSQGSWTYRFYNECTITISVADGYAITSIEFTGSNLGNASISWDEAGTFSNNIWTANSSAGVKSMSVSKTATGNNPTISQIVVNYKKANTSGVGSIEADENAPVEYYNLQGVRVANPAAGQLVIKRQGTTVTKVLVK